jgi:hypothetical protein
MWKSLGRAADRSPIRDLWRRPACTRKSKFDTLAKDIRGIPSDAEIPGASLGIDSDGFFDLEEQRKRVAAVGTEGHQVTIRKEKRFKSRLAS